MTPADLFQAATIPSRTTGYKALRELLADGQIQREGKGWLRVVSQLAEALARPVRARPIHIPKNLGKKKGQ
jgi:hypothetical protein